MMTCLHWIVGYFWLEIWTKSVSLETDVFAQLYALVVVNATIGLEYHNGRQ